jgi:hypothetical protein
VARAFARAVGRTHALFALSYLAPGTADWQRIMRWWIEGARRTEPIPDYSRSLVVTRFIGSNLAKPPADRMNGLTTNN